MKKVNNLTLRQQIFRDELRTLCINKEWYTKGDIKEYDAMFDKLHEDMTDDEVLDICKDIYDHSDVEQTANTYGVSYDEIFDNIVYEVFGIVHTFVKR